MQQNTFLILYTNDGSILEVESDESRLDLERKFKSREIRYMKFGELELHKSSIVVFEFVEQAIAV